MEALTIIAWLSILLGALSAIIIYVDIQMGHYQPMRIMNIAWPVTALFIWPAVLYVYFKYGRAHVAHNQHQSSDDHSQDHHHQDQQTPVWVDRYISSTHCAAGCSLGDILGESLIYIFGLTIAGSFLWMGYIVDFILALIFGLAFQYYSIKPMQPNKGTSSLLKQAFKADILSLISFQIGMYLWMFISVYLIFAESINAGDPIFWLMMQIAMILGMLTTMPVNKWLIQVGIKHSCH